MPNRDWGRARWIVGALLLGALGCERAPTPTASPEPAAPGEAEVAEADEPASAQPEGIWHEVVGPSEAARTLVVIHGGPGLSHDYLRPLEALAGEQRRVVFYDQRGVGHAPAPADERYDVAAYVTDLEALRRQLKAERIDLVGHSWGGLLALSYAVEHPDTTGAVLLVDSMPPTFEALQAGSQRFGQRLMGLVQSGAVTAEIPPQNAEDCSAHVRAILPTYFADPEHAAASEFVGSCNGLVSGATMQALGPYDLRPSLDAVSGRVMVVFGKEDPFGAQWGDEIVAALPNADVRQEVIDGAGHFPWLEGADAFFGASEAFLR